MMQESWPCSQWILQLYESCCRNSCSYCERRLEEREWRPCSGSQESRKQQGKHQSYNMPSNTFLPLSWQPTAKHRQSDRCWGCKGLKGIISAVTTANLCTQHIWLIIWRTGVVLSQPYCAVRAHYGWIYGMKQRSRQHYRNQELWEIRRNANVDQKYVKLWQRSFCLFVRLCSWCELTGVVSL